MSYLLITVATLTSLASLIGPDYERICEKDGVAVYQRRGSSVIDLAAEGDFDAPPARVLAVLLDYPRHPRFLKSLAESTILRRDDHSLDVYQRLDLPIISDRDFTLHVTWTDEDGVLWLRFKAADERGPAPKDGVVRVHLHEGGWRLEPRDGGRRTHATYFMRLDLAGSLPRWMSRGRAGDDVPGLFESFRRELR